MSADTPLVTTSSAAAVAEEADEALFDEIVHAPVRLRICSLLRRADRVDFAVVRDTLGVADATLSKHVKVLVDAGYVTVEKGRSAARTDARRMTWLGLTAPGRRAFDAHVAELRRIAAGLDGTA